MRGSIIAATLAATAFGTLVAPANAEPTCHSQMAACIRIAANVGEKAMASEIGKRCEQKLAACVKTGYWGNLKIGG